MSEATERTDVARPRGRRVTRTGVVVSDKGDKSLRVRYEYKRKHPKYGKYMKRSTTLHVHDELNASKEGDLVEVCACRRLSKTKFWRLVRVINAA